MSTGLDGHAGSYLPGSLPRRSRTLRESTTSSSEPISTPASIRTLPLAFGSRSRNRGLVDTSVAADRDAISSIGSHREIAISAITLAELIVGPRVARDEPTRARRRAHLTYIERALRALPFDSRCARAWPRIFVAVTRIGRKPRGSRAVDLMIAATALAHDLPLYTVNAKDFRGLGGLVEVVDLTL